ncbi:MAG: aldehyde dehydrogenase family protein [Alphaproteobacteria bacterium]
MTSSTGPNMLSVNAAFDGTQIAQLPCDDIAAAEEALAIAYKLFRDRRTWLPIPDRVDILRRAGDIMRARIEELTLQAAREGGKPYTDSKIELRRAIDGVDNCIEVLRADGGEVIPMGINKPSAGRVAFTRREPIGVVVAVSAFNHPMNLIVHQVAPGVAAGCPVIVKPAPDTPLSGKAFVEILHEAGLPPEWCQLIITDQIDVAEKLVTDERVGIFSFIGSARVGWMLRSKLAHGTRAALEHGGAAPVIVAADADLDDAVPRMVKGGFYHAGQVCVSVQRVFAHADIARSLAEQIAQQAGALIVGDPTNPETEIGPLIRPGEVTRVGEWVKEAIDGGGECLTGGKAISETCYAPTVLYDPPAKARVSTSEIFGPVVCIFPFTDMDEALKRANALPYAFQAAVFTRDIETATQAYAGLDASAVMVNDHTAFRVDWMPFAGLRQSGLGVGGIPHTFDEMTIQKMMVLRSDRL